MDVASRTIEELRNRLVKRGTDSPEVIEDRIARAEYELTFASKFDVVVVNDVLEIAEEEALHLIETFLQEDEKAQEDED